jgi:[protein-PII] uridylyltransferase
MSDYLDRTRAALRNLFGARPVDAPAPAAEPSAAVPIDSDLSVAGGHITFGNADRAATNPRAWLRLFEGALERRLAIAPAALDLIRAQTSQLSANEMLWGTVECRRFVSLLQPQSGLAARLGELLDCGVLSVLFPEFYVKNPDSHAVAAVGRVERLLTESDLTGTRFGTMLKELDAPQLVVLALLLHQPAASKDHDPAKAAELAGPALDRLLLEDDARHAVEFLIANQLQMAQFAFRQDTSDPTVIAKFAESLSRTAELNSISGEEQLKMLAVMTIGDLGAGGRTPLTSWRAELLWRLFVDTYNHLTMVYGDEVIDRDAATRTALHLARPSDITETELVQFLEGLPHRYLTLFDAETIYKHVRLGRNMGPDDVHTFLTRKEKASDLTVVTLDKAYLFSNICGVLASLGADILRGQALTSRSGLALDVFEFADGGHPVNPQELNQRLKDVVTGKVDVATRLAESQRNEQRPRPALPLLHFDNDSSHRYTILEIVADDVPGLLYRVSRALSGFGCEVDLVLISTEADKAIDVFHMRKGGGKLTDSDQLALTDHLERAIRDSA